ncbi:MAG TPA: hypothetical protein VIK72_07955 [Clostridiaceae bacterium]
MANAILKIEVYDPAWTGYNDDLATKDTLPFRTDINGNFNITATSPVARGVETSINGHIYDYAGIFLLYYPNPSDPPVILPVTNLGNPEPLYIYGY